MTTAFGSDVSIPVKSSSALSSTSSSGLCFFSSIRLLAALRDVKISFSDRGGVFHLEVKVETLKSFE